MSREILTALTFDKDFRGVKYSGYSSNVYPRDVYKYHNKAKDEFTTLDYVASFVTDVINFSIELPKNNKLQIYVNMLFEHETRISLYDTDIYGQWENDKNDKFGLVWLNEEAKEKFEQSKKRFERKVEYVATMFMNNSLDEKIKELKNKKYILTNGYSYLTKITSKKFSYNNTRTEAKVFNGFEIEAIPQYVFNNGFKAERIV